MTERLVRASTWVTLLFGFGCAWFSDLHPKYIWHALAAGWLVALADAWFVLNWLHKHKAKSGE